jgi:hypothetical protein
MPPKKISPHVLVLIDGQSFSGKAVPQTFTIKSPDGTFPVPAKQISSITFDRGNPAGKDEITLKSQSRIRGDIQEDPLPFVVADIGQTIKFPHSRLHTLVMFFAD